MTRLAIAAVALALLPACFGPDPNLTDAGKGKPLITVDFPDTAAPGEVATATFTVENPGPGDIRSVAIAFASVGAAAASGPLPVDLVPITTSDDNPAIASIEPEPDDVSPDGVVYFFGALPEGESVDISFDILVPETTGTAANSVSVYDAADTARIRGLRLETVVRG